MAAVFKRSLSFPNKPKTTRPPSISHHIRSISLPCRSHPLISQLKDEVNHLKTMWPSSPNQNTVQWLCDGLSRLKHVHDSFSDLLQLPQTHECLGAQQELVEKLLEDFLRFLDAYGIFQTSFLGLKEAILFAEVALRKKEVLMIDTYNESCKRIAKEMNKLSQSVKAVTNNANVINSSSIVAGGQEHVELVSIIDQVVEVTISVTLALFKGISCSLSSRKCSKWKVVTNWVLAYKGQKKIHEIEQGIEEFKDVISLELKNYIIGGDGDSKQVYLKKVRNLEGSVCDIESCGHKVFRGLINARASLLNYMGQ